MVVRRLPLAFLCLLLGAAVLTAQAQDSSHGGIAVSDAWARATPAAARNGSVYATVHNGGDAPDRLLGIESDVAASGAIHEMTMDNGVARMRPVNDGLAVAPGESVTLAPGGMHGMLIGLKQPLKAGETLHAMAVFERAGRIAIAVPVVAMGAPSPEGQTMEMQPGMEMPQGGSRP